MPVEFGKQYIWSYLGHFEKTRRKAQRLIEKTKIFN
jgi:hypothetical protein